MIGLPKKSVRIWEYQIKDPNKSLLISVVSSHEIEKKIHNHLRAIGHGGPKRKEWFQTNEQSVHRVVNAFEDSGFLLKDMLAWKKGSAHHRAQRVSIVFQLPVHTRCTTLLLLIFILFIL